MTPFQAVSTVSISTLMGAATFFGEMNWFIFVLGLVLLAVFWKMGEHKPKSEVPLPPRIETKPDTEDKIRELLEKNKR